MSQIAQIQAALERGDSLTPLDALRRYGSFRLGAHIWELKRRGHQIETKMVKINGKRVARYSLVREPEQLALV